MANRTIVPASGVRPFDWPEDGPIDLNIHDLPHASSTLEWWYMHTHIKTASKRNLSLFASFFRAVVGYDKKTKKPIIAHSLIWAISDIDKKEYHTVSLIDKRAPQLGLERLKKGQIVNDPFLKRAAIEMLEKGVVPYPDELLQKDAKIGTSELSLDYDGNTFKKQKDGSYLLKLKHKKLQISADLRIVLKKPPTRHGDNGLVKGVYAEDMFYYFIPRCAVAGKVKIKNETLTVKAADGWYDHEFGCPPESKKSTLEVKNEVAWNWAGIQLNNGCELSVYDLINYKTGESCGAYSILIDEKGKRHQSDKFTLTPFGEEWTSARTFTAYPLRWILTIPGFGIRLEIESESFPNQEFGTVISKPAFWEGHINVSGTMQNKKLKGQGYLERHGYIKNNSLKEFLKAVSAETLKSVKKIIPTSFGQEKLEELVSGKGNSHLTAGLDKEAYIGTHIKPIREIIDRGGKSWRSYATIACCDVVGGNSQKALDWLALPELMHVGSLIVDDVQDRSDIRRGGPAAHKIYGEATAINSGTACYFIGQICIYEGKVSDAKKVQIYNWYFETMRACHSGQAMDIHGLDYMMPEVLMDDKIAQLLSKRVYSIHRLKSAAPASYLARIGALLGDGTQKQIDGLGAFYEALGIAFQIIDDTLNLKGFQDNLKTKAEDITAGKITYPIAKAMGLITKEERKRLWEIVSAKTSDIVLLTEAMALLSRYQVIEKCEKEAKSIMDKAWKNIDPLLPDSMVKLNLRAFSWFVLERTY